MMAQADDSISPERPVAKFRTETFRQSRPSIVGPDIPEPPYPITLSGPVQKGFGRGSKELGCPTANLPDESIEHMSSVAQTGVYFGYARVLPNNTNKDALSEDNCKVHPMVMSLGYNPYYDNKKMTAEIHIMHNYDSDFYGYEMRAVVLGYIRPELNYTSREALIEDIETDKKVASGSLDRPAYKKFITDELFTSCDAQPQ